MNACGLIGLSRWLTRAVVISLMLRTVGAGQASVVEIVEEPASLDTGELFNPSPEVLEVEGGRVQVQDAAWIRVRLGASTLGEESFIILGSAVNGDFQRFDVRSLADWYGWSGMFQGSEVTIAVHIAPGETVRVIADATRRPISGLGAPGFAPFSICGSNDDRVASSDPHVARMPNSGCTGWLVTNGAVLSAGHCAPVAAGDVVEFNVPASYANGITRPAALADQYPINAASAVWEDSGPGQDWLVFGLNANSTTGLHAHVVQGSYRMTKSVPANGTTIRVTGFGLDNAPAGGGSVCVGGTSDGLACTKNADCLPEGAGQCVAAPCCDPDGAGPLGCGFDCNAASRTQQTHTGTIVSSNTNLITHSVDTTPANSGSPIIWATNGYTLGIHTDGGCTSTGGSNGGTRFSRAVLETAIREFVGPGAIYVDAFNGGLAANGGVFEPLHAVSPAVTAVAHGGTICLVAGSYPASAGNTFVAGADGKAMTFVAPVGTATIGN